MVEMYHSQAQWDNHTAPRIHEAFAQIHGTERLWVSHDRVSITPPSRDPDAPESGLHWDHGIRLMSVEEAKAARPTPGSLQGVLYLVDTPAANGAFVCVPGFHKKLDDWLDTLPEDGEDPAKQDLLALGTTRVGASAGDLVIWDSRLPHTAALNRGHAPRVAQYITMSPAAEDQSLENRKGRIEWYEQRGAWAGKLEKEHESGECATLTPLGKQLAGVEPWPPQEGQPVSRL